MNPATPDAIGDRMKRRSPNGQRGDQSKSDQTRQRLLDAAAMVLADKGLNGTRVADIAQAAETQVPHIYYYFATREELVSAVLVTGAETVCHKLEETLAGLEDKGSPVTDRLLAAVEFHLREQFEVSDYSRAIIRNLNELPEPTKSQCRTAITAYNQLWRNLIVELRENNLLRPDLRNRETVAVMLVVGALNWATEWWTSSRGAIDELIATAQRMALHTLCTDEAAARGLPSGEDRPDQLRAVR